MRDTERQGTECYELCPERGEALDTEARRKKSPAESPTQHRSRRGGRRLASLSGFSGSLKTEGV